MPEAILYTTRKLDTAGDPLPGSTHTWKPVSAGGFIVCEREARQSGRPGDTATLIYIDNGTWMENLWTGRPFDKSPTIDMQNDQSNTTERYNIRGTNATDF